MFIFVSLFVRQTSWPKQIYLLFRQIEHAPPVLSELRTKCALKTHSVISVLRMFECSSIAWLFAQSIAWEQHGTTRQKPPAIRTLMISQHTADYAKIYAIVPSCSIYFQHGSTILETSAKYKIGIYHRIYIYGYIMLHPSLRKSSRPHFLGSMSNSGVLNFDSLSSLDLLKFLQVERFSELLQRQTQPLQCLRPAKSIE